MAAPGRRSAPERGGSKCAQICSLPGLLSISRRRGFKGDQAFAQPREGAELRGIYLTPRPAVPGHDLLGRLLREEAALELLLGHVVGNRGGARQRMPMPRYSKSPMRCQARSQVSLATSCCSGWVSPLAARCRNRRGWYRSTRTWKAAWVCSRVPVWSRRTRAASSDGSRGGSNAQPRPGGEFPNLHGRIGASLTRPLVRGRGSL